MRTFGHMLRYAAVLVSPVLVLSALNAGTSGASPTSGTLSIFAGTGQLGTPQAGPATSSPVNSPNGIAVDAKGNVYVVDNGNGVVDKIDTSGHLSIFAGTPGHSGTPQPGKATQSPLDAPYGVGVDGAGNVYIADGGANVIEKVTPQGILSIVAGTGSAAAAVPGPATSSPMDSPYAVEVDSHGNLYIADTFNSDILKVDSSGTLSVFANAFQLPVGLAIDAEGNVYVADVLASSIIKLTPAGVPSVVAGPSDVDGPAGLAFDAGGNLYIACYGDYVVKMVTPSGVSSVVAGTTGQAGPPSPGPALSSPLAGPVAVAVTPTGKLLITDPANSVVEAVTGVAAGMPGAPTQVTGTAGSSSVALSWRAPIDDGNRPVTGYVVQYSSDNGSQWHAVTGCTGTGTTCTVTGLSAGGSYVFRVATTTAVGTGPFSATSGSVHLNSGPPDTATPTTSPSGPPGNSSLAATGTNLLGLGISAVAMISVGVIVSAQRKRRDRRARLAQPR